LCLANTLPNAPRGRKLPDMSRTLRKASLLALFAFNLVICETGFRGLFGESYFGWYVENGDAVFLFVGVVSLALNWDRYPDCISADPYRYYEAWHTLLTDSYGELGEPFRGRREGWLTGARRLDLVISVMLLPVWMLAVAAWTAVTWSAQYVLFLFCGAPARLMLAARGERPVSGYASRPVTFTAAVGAAALYGLSRVV